MIQIALLGVLVPKMGIIGAALSTALAYGFGMVLLGYSFRKFHYLEIKIRDVIYAGISFGMLILVLKVLSVGTMTETILSLISRHIVLDCVGTI